jgi:hypothetical protein
MNLRIHQLSGVKSVKKAEKLENKKRISKCNEYILDLFHNIFVV